MTLLGDGINDTLALTEATVGVAMGSGADVARESADIVLFDGRVSEGKRVREISIAGDTVRIHALAKASACE